VPLGPGAVAALRAALRQALHLGHNYIGTEHILLGLVEEDDATAATLAALGVTRTGAQEQIRAAFAAMRASQPRSGA
jgi:ATP-dependent Clp protease ATP-binding subunit ClpA